MAGRSRGPHLDGLPGFHRPRRPHRSDPDLLRVAGRRRVAVRPCARHADRARAVVRRVEPSPLIDLRDGYEDWACRRGVVAELERKRRRLARDRVDRFGSKSQPAIRWCSIGSPPGSRLSTFARGSAICSPSRGSGLRRRAARQRRDELFSGRLSALWAGDDLVAAHLGMSSGPTWHWWIPAYDPDSSRYSPGAILLLEMVRAAAAAGSTVIDLGKGVQLYKTRFANAEIMMTAGLVERHGPLVDLRRVLRERRPVLRRRHPTCPDRRTAHEPRTAPSSRLAWSSPLTHRRRAAWARNRGTRVNRGSHPTLPIRAIASGVARPCRYPAADERPDGDALAGMPDDQLLFVSEEAPGTMEPFGLVATTGDPLIEQADFVEDLAPNRHVAPEQAGGRPGAARRDPARRRSCTDHTSEGAGSRSRSPGRRHLGGRAHDPAPQRSSRGGRAGARSSSSRNTMTRPRAARTPLLRAALTPPLLRRTMWTGTPGRDADQRASSLAVSSVLPSSTTSTSNRSGASVCVSRLSSVPSTRRPWLYVGTTTETVRRARRTSLVRGLSA